MMKLYPIVLFFLFGHILCSQIQDKVDFINGRFYIYPKPETKNVLGRATYKFLILKNVDSIFLDAKNINFSDVELNKKATPFKYNGKRIVINEKFEKDNMYALTFDFESTPEQTVYFLGSDDNIKGNEQIWTQGQGKYTSHWLPSLDDMNDKLVFNFTIVADKNYQVISNGKLTNFVEKDSINVWFYNMQKPMSSYLAAFALGNFDKKTIKSASGTPIELYYEPKDSLKVEPTYRHSKQIFDFLENEIGFPYPWQNYKQVPVQDFLYAGMENTGATIFSNTYMVDSIAFSDKNYVNVNAHELAHQWFGNLVTEQSGEHHWLHEGFATYYAYLAEREVFGEDYFYWRLLETAKSLVNFSGDGNGEALTSSSAGSLTFYEKGAWALVMLRERVGDVNFREGVQNYLAKYAYQNVTISDFMWEMEKASGMELSDFDTTWLQESEFPFETVKEFLFEKNTSIKTYFEFKDRIGDNLTSAETILKYDWGKLESDYLKKQLVLDYGHTFSVDFLSQILKNESIKVRQAVAFSLQKVPLEIQLDYEKLLVDKSYSTVESALYRLWTDFPNNQNKYLNKTSGIIGMPNKNVRLLWLTLALVSPDYNIGLKPTYFEELSGYTGLEHHFEVRLLAFQYLKSIGGFNDSTLKNLIEACSHHVWHFKKSSRKILKEFLKGEENVARIKDIYPSLNQQEKQYLDKALGK